MENNKIISGQHFIVGDNKVFLTLNVDGKYIMPF